MENSERFDYRKVISDCYKKRVAKNSGYSMRAFAKDLGVDSGFLNHLLARRRSLSLLRATEIVGKLKLSVPESETFLDLVRLESRLSDDIKASILKNLESKLDGEVQGLSLEAYRAVADWYHFAICELTTINNYRLTARSAATRLGISVLEAKEAIARLEKIGLIEKKKNGQYKKASQMYESPHGIADVSKKIRHKQFLEKAIVAIDEQSLEERMYTSLTMAIDPDDMPQIQKRISEFALSLCREFEAKNVEEVYELGVQFISLETKRRKKK